MKVLAFGEILWDIINGQPHLGGAPFNFAAHYARCGNKAFIVSCVGNDNLGWRALSEAGRLGVDCSYVTLHPQAPTGTVDVYLNQGEPDYTIIENVAFDEIQPAEELFQEPHRFDILYIGSLAQRKQVSANTLRRIIQALRFQHIFYDVNLRKNTWNKQILHDSLGICTIVKLNVAEVSVVSQHLLGATLAPEQFAQQIVERYPKIAMVIITASEAGCYVYDRKNFHHAPGTVVPTIDSIGAGDAFSAFFLHAYCNTKDPLRSAIMANRIGAFVASSRGAIPTYPLEIITLLESIPPVPTSFPKG